MRQFRRLAEDVDTSLLIAQIEAHPELWNQFTTRKYAPDSPHSQMSDIWVRYRKWEELQSPEDYKGQHIPVWYPAWYTLSALYPIVYGLIAQERPVHLGGVLITKIPPGCRIEPHDDIGTWHAEYHNLKVYLPIKSNARCVNTCGDDELNMRTGEMWTFNNLVTHSVENRGRDDRITLIISMRVE